MAKLDALTDSRPARRRRATNCLLNADRNPNSTGARLIGICRPRRWDQTCQRSPRTSPAEHQDVDRFWRRRDQGTASARICWPSSSTLIVSDILPNKTTELAHYLLPGCAHAEKRGSFVNAKGRVQRFMQNIQPKGDARPEWEFLHELATAVAPGADGVVHHRRTVSTNGGGSARVQRADVGGAGRLGSDRADLNLGRNE